MTIPSNTPPIIAAAIARRTAAGLKITFLIPADCYGPEREFACYPHDEATKQRWIATKAKKGWTVKP